MNQIRTKKSCYSILVVFDWYDHRIYQGIAKYCIENNWHLAPYCFSDPQLPSSWSGDGAITCYSETLSDFICSLKIPIVDITLRDIPQDIPRVVIDYDQAGLSAAQYFLRKGFKEFAHLTLEIGIANNIRKHTFSSTLKEASIPEEKRYELNPTDGNTLTDLEKYIQTIVERINQLPRPLAVFIEQDNIALKLIEACVDAGISIPDEVAILGVGNTEFLCECSIIPLSSVETHLTDLGYSAAEQLGRLINGEIDKKEPVRMIPCGDVVSRRSTEALAVSHPSVSSAIKIMQNHFKDGLVLEDIYENVKISKRGLEKAFKKHLNDSPASVLRKIRLNYAKDALTDTESKIEAIALECGYSNSSNFSHAFSRKVGISPQEYRNHYK